MTRPPIPRTSMSGPRWGAVGPAPVAQPMSGRRMPGRAAARACVELVDLLLLRQGQVRRVAEPRQQFVDELSR